MSRVESKKCEGVDETFATCIGLLTWSTWVPILPLLTPIATRLEVIGLWTLILAAFTGHST